MLDYERPVDIDEPLQFRQGLDEASRTFGGRDGLLRALFFFKQALAFEPLDDYLARFGRLLAFESASDRHLCVFIYHDDFMRKLVTIGDIPVDTAMCRSESDRAGAESRIDFFV